MFNFFKSSDSHVKVIDKVWISSDAKWRACASMARINPDCIFVVWFDNTLSKLKEVLGSDERIIMADRMDASKAIGTMVVFVEHYPLSKPEQTLFASLNLKDVPIVSSLDEPLFMHFGGERTIELMKKLGLEEDEPVGHSMITQSIHKAQSKLEKLVAVEHKATSAQEWFDLNVKK